MIAVLADIHANRPALTAVLAEARRRGAARLVVLGDVVGYYAEPDACVELLAAWSVEGVIGNHDLGALGVVDRHAGRVAASIQAWTAAHLAPASCAFLRALPRRLALPWATAVHGTFTHPDGVVGYVTPATADANLAAVVAGGRRLGLCGHSHVPALHVAGDRHHHPLVAGAVPLPAEAAAIFNPGSVGQPRDGDPRAAFALFDPEAGTMQLVRVPYDIGATARALAAAGLEASLARRLEEAR